ncbi:S-methyl-5-thioribose-1-phosphate isomerase [Paenibacillus larvae]
MQSITTEACSPLISLTWEGDHLALLDQRLLPEEVVYLRLHTPEEVAEAIRHLAVRGAPAIGIAAAYGVYLGMKDFQARADAAEDDAKRQLLAVLRAHAILLAGSRPTAVNLFWALDRMKRRAEAFTVDERITVQAMKQSLLAEAVRIHKEDEDTNRRIGEHALTLFTDGMGVLTHCNAGALATAKYGTALELQRAGLDVTLICDNMAGAIMAKGWVQAVIVGTDRVAANGDVANKIGTYSVAVLARAHEIPFYVACPLSTIDLSTPTGADIPIEERIAEEITEGFGKRTAPRGVKVYNPAFDITPHDYVSGIITEKGIVKGNYKEGLRKLFQSRLS